MIIVAAIFGFFVLALLVAAIGGAVGGWALMLIMGILHHEVSASIPALGFWVCAALAALFGVLTTKPKFESSSN